MRYIKNFNSLIKESTEESSREELKDFCEMNLAYLLDDDFTISLTPSSYLPSTSDNYESGHRITFQLGDGPKGEGFTWSQIMDHFIPFLQRLSNSYKVIKCLIRYEEPLDGITFPLNYYQSHTSVQSLIDNELPEGQFEDTVMLHIRIIVEDEW